MASLALAFDILARDQGASETLENVADSAENAGEQGTQFGEKMKTGMKVAGAAVAALGVAALAGLKSSVDAASDLGESVNAVGVVFGDAADEVLSMGRNAAKSVGLSNTTFNSLAVQFSSFAQKIGGPGGTARTIDELTKRAADFASVMNLDVAEAANIFQSALSGETEPIKAFGIDLSAAAVSAYAAANGIGAVGAELTATEKTQATYGLLMAETAKTAGDFANTSDSLANRQRILEATFTDVKASIGAGFLPALQGAAGYILDVAIPAVTGLKDGAQQLFDVLFKGDFKGGPLSEDSAIVDKAFDLRDAAISLRDWWRDEALPALERFNVFMVQTFQPTFEELSKTIREDFAPAARSLKASFEENKPAIEAVLQVLGALAVIFGVLRLKMLGDLLPPLIDFAGFLVRVFAANVNLANDVLRMLGGWLSSAGDFAQRAYDKLGLFSDALSRQKLPQWIKDLANMVESIAGGLSSGASKIASFFGQGDGPGRAVRVPGGGGSTLSKVQSLLPAGAVVTSTYRTPGQNAAVGGVPGSYHTDVKNPAVDIGGTRAAMDQVYARLAAIGGWRELLYKTPGHWDHVHVAHQGGEVSATWPSMPGWGPDERPVRAQVGETILPKGATPGTAVSLEGMTVVLQVGEREFTGYVAGVADSRVVAGLRTAGRR